MANKLLNQLGMPSPNRAITDLNNREKQRERNYDIIALNTFVQENITYTNQQQKTPTILLCKPSIQKLVQFIS